jgi:hypothetical protein
MQVRFIIIWRMGYRASVVKLSWCRKYFRVVKASLHTRTCELRRSAIEDHSKGKHAAPSWFPQGPANLTCTNFSNIRRRYHVDSPLHLLNIGAGNTYRTLQTMTVPMLRRASREYILSPAEKRSERTRSICDECRTGLANTVGKREAKVGLKELFDVRPPDILCLFNFHDAKNLHQE